MRATRLVVAAASVSFSAALASCGGTSEPKFGPPAAVSVVSGATGPVTAGATAAIPLVARVADASDRPVPGVSVTWTAPTGSITPGAATTDGNGQSTAQWIPGTASGTQTASATVTGVGTASFAATVAPAALAKVKMTPDTIKFTGSGQTRTIVASGLDAFGNFIPSSIVGAVFTSDDNSIATVTSAGTTTAIATGTTTIRATASAGPSGATTVIVSVPDAASCGAQVMTLGVGESRTLTGDAASQLCINGATGAEYVLVPFFATGDTSSFAAALPLNFTPLSNIGAVGPPTADVLSNARLRASVSAAARSPLRRDVAWELGFRERVRKKLRPLMRAARSAQVRPSGVRNDLRISRTAAPAPGDSIQLNIAIDSACSPTNMHWAAVRAVTDHAIVVTDNQNPAGFAAQDYLDFGNQFDKQVWPTDTRNFGTETDIDGNGRVILFFTSAVNKLTPRNNTTSFVGGFFYGRDLVPRTPPTPGELSCAGSNLAEMFYLLAPDPDAVDGNARSVDFVKSITMGTVAHEFQHLINFGYHLYSPIVFKDFESTFLDEGLAHEAEELNYYVATARHAGTNIDATVMVTPTDAYQAYARQNVLRFSDYLLKPEKYGPYSPMADTSLAVRGGIWSLLRYSADQRSGVPEQSTWLQLVKPQSPVTGVENLKAVFGANFLAATMKNWSVANYMDDAQVPNTDPAFTHPSWNMRSVETFAAGSNIYPLKTISLVNGVRSVSLADGAAAYFRFGVDAGKVGGALVTSAGPLPSTFSITVIRTK